GEAAVAGLDAAALEQHGAWAAGGTAVDQPRESADADLIAALAATAAAAGRVPEVRRVEPVAEAPRPEPVL
ncbi:glutamyl-tRNA reductase, partial [Streptomyces sp. TRM76130]|nr:glutamyl-tRNA reductase [Streptomyces sp. TRM76130]